MTTVNTDATLPLWGEDIRQPPTFCSATTQYGRPCQKPPQPGKETCWSHDLKNAEQRKSNARAGGAAAHSPGTLELQELKDELKVLIREVKDGKVAPNVATVVTQPSNVILRAIEQDRKVREQEELQERIAALKREARP